MEREMDGMSPFRGSGRLDQKMLASIAEATKTKGGG